MFIDSLFNDDTCRVCGQSPCNCTHISEAAGPEGKIAALEKKIDAKQNQLEVARERRKMSGKSKGVQSQREVKLGSEISKLRQELHILKTQLNESVDQVTLGATVQHRAGGVGKVTRIVDDQQVIVKDEHGQTYKVMISDLTPVTNEDWQKVNKQDKTDGMSQKAVNAYRRENPGSKLKTAVTTEPSKLKKGSKASKRRSSYCSRSKGQMDMHNISCAKTPDKAICKARRRWNCESVEQTDGVTLGSTVRRTAGIQQIDPAVKKKVNNLCAYIKRNLDMLVFDVELAAEKDKPYHEPKLDNKFTTADGTPVYIVFNDGGDLKVYNGNILNIPIGFMSRFRSVGSYGLSGKILAALGYTSGKEQSAVSEAAGLYGPYVVTINTGERPQSRTKTKKFRREDDAILWAEDWLEDFPQYVYATIEITDPEGNVVWYSNETMIHGQPVAEGYDNINALIQKLEDMSELIFQLPPSSKKNKLMDKRDELEANIETMPGGKEALRRWAHEYNDSFDESVAEGVEILNQESDLDQEVFELSVDGQSVSFTLWDYENNFTNVTPRDIFDQVKEQLPNLSLGQQKQVTKTVYASFKKSGVTEAGAFSYGAKKPRNGSVADLAAKKRKEQERGKQPIEPKDQMVGNAKVTKDVAEAKSLTKQVRIVKGPHAGKTGWIRQIKHGAFKGAPKSYFIDLDDGGQADNLPASALRLVKDVAEGKAERDTNRTWAQITDYEKRAKATKNDIKKQHYMKMAAELRRQLPTTEDLKDPADNPCWKGYHPVGTKEKNGKTVPNCVPESGGTDQTMHETHSGSAHTARIDRMLQKLRSRHPEASDDLEAFLLDFEKTQRQDRSDIERLGAENDAEDAEIDYLNKEVDSIEKKLPMNEGLWNRALTVAESKVRGQKKMVVEWASKWYQAHGGQWATK